ncbi:hypothetical protein WMZ97_12220 [Lentibacillus sp. N15]|uniref:hypothetical protein n=1 Tax=Lentibacillus songyuanensis TaxID=3136161 RepID=UPI0031B9C7CB
MEYILGPIFIMVIYNVFTEKKISFRENILGLILVAGGFFIIQTFDGYIYFISMLILAAVFVLLDYLFSKKEKTWSDEIYTFLYFLGITFIAGFIGIFLNYIG